VTKANREIQVALFVDFEHFQRPIRQYTSSTGGFLGTLEALTTRVRELGVVALACVYANWAQHPGIPTELKRLQLDPRFVLPQTSAKSVSVTRGHSTVLTLALDALQTVFERPEIQTYVLVTGDSALVDLIGRLRGHRKDVLLLGFEQFTSPDLISAAGQFETLDDFFQPGQFVGADTPPSPDAFEEAAATDFDWEPFILLLARLEQNLAFIGLKYLKNHVLTAAHGCEDTQESKASLIREAIRLKIIDTSKVPNPHNRAFATTTCRLNRAHPAVKRALTSQPSEV
jgi:hypothetical protein